MSTRRLRPFLSRTSLVETERLRALAAAAEPLRTALKPCACARSVQPEVVQVNIMSGVPFLQIDWLKDSEMLRDQGLVVSHLAGAPAERDAPGVEDHDIVGEGEGELDVLLDQKNRLAFMLQAQERAADLRDDQRRKSFGRLVHQQHRSEEHTSELQSRVDLVCRLLLEKKKKKKKKKIKTKINTKIKIEQ